MEYKAGDKVKIKTWKKMEEEFGSSGDFIKMHHGFMKGRERALNTFSPSRVLEVKEVKNYRKNDIVYTMEGNLGGYNTWWTDDSIEGLFQEDSQKEINVKDELFYKDMLGRIIKKGDHVLHLWCRIDTKGNIEGGPSKIKHKLATVIKLNPKSIRIRYRDKRKNKESNITNTKNRIIVMKDNELKITPEDISEAVMKEQDQYRKTMNTRLRNTKEELKEFKKTFDILLQERDELKEVIQELTKGSERFRLLDLE